MNTQDLYNKYTLAMQKIADVENTISVLGWDNQVNLPTKGARFRAQQIATLSGIYHELFIDKKLGALLQKLNEVNGLADKPNKNVTISLHDYQRKIKLDKAFVIRRSEIISEAYQAWGAARKANDFNVFKDALKKVVNIKREEAELLGYEEHPYDSLIDNFEPGGRTKVIAKLFKEVRVQLMDLVRQIRQQPQVDDSFLKKFYPKDKQWDYSLTILKKLGYDFEAGRQDLTVHPFCTHFSPEDVRVTTRVDEHNFTDMLMCSIHECGHALYEQGLSSEQYGLPLGSSISKSIHESQAILQENNLGRSYDFWRTNFPTIKDIFSEQLEGVELDTFYKAFNKVSPTLNRTKSDELHFHFHIIIRFELEKGLIEGSLEVDDLDQVWNAKYKEYLGLEVPDDFNGILQDIHWAKGYFGYFPTYSLGSFYAAQFFHQANKDIPNLKELIASGNNQPLLKWLRSNIHQHGRYYTGEELCKKVTGETLNIDYFMQYAKDKFKVIYGIKD